MPGHYRVADGNTEDTQTHQGQGQTTWPCHRQIHQKGRERETGLVVATDPRAHTVTVRLRDPDWVVDEEHLDALDLAYARDPYRAQGRTVAEVLVCGGGWQRPTGPPATSGSAEPKRPRW